MEYLKNEEVHPQLIAEHEKIIEHIMERDKAKASAIVSEHINNQVEGVIDIIRTKQSETE